MKTLVLGLGNPILGDDGVGLQVADKLAVLFHRPDITILKTEQGGINLLEQLVGYGRAIIIDAIQTSEGKPGQIYQFSPESLPGTCHVNSAHGMNFGGVLEVGKKLGLNLPDEIIILAIAVRDVNIFKESCNPEIESTIPECIEKIKQLLMQDSISVQT